MNAKQAKSSDDDEILPEYDFSEGIRGKHYGSYQRVYQVIIHKLDGTSEEYGHTPNDGACPTQHHQPTQER